MKISLFQGILMGVFGLGAVIGLFVFATYKGSSSEVIVGPVLIWGTLPKEGMEATLGGLSSVDPDLKNVTYVEKNAATLANDLATAIATGVSPDLVLASQEELTALAKFIAPIPFSTLSAATYESTFINEGNLFMAPNGGYYGIPFLVDPLVLFSNRTILSSSGIARPPNTWEAMIGLVPSVALLTPSRQVTRGLIALGTYGNVRDARAILSTLFIQTGVPLAKRSTAGTLVADLGVPTDNEASLGKAVLGFYTQFADAAKASYTWNASLPDSEQMFQNGDLALYLGYVSRARSLRAANPNLDFAVTEVPQPATASVKSVYGLVYAFMIPRGAKNPAGAFSVAALFSHPTEQKAASATIGLAPATLSQLSTLPSDPIAAVAYSEALYARGWLSPAAASTDQVFSGMIGNVTSGRSTIDTALSTAEQSLTALLQQ